MAKTWIFSKINLVTARKKKKDFSRSSFSF